MIGAIVNNGNGNGSQKSPKRAERQTNFKVVIRVIKILSFIKCLNI
jgi:hypothetical protein